MQLKFSIVIPSRNRHETLPFTLQSCFHQDYDNYEVIVCDNSSDEETKKCIHPFLNNKLVYHKAPVSLSMSDNWELAVSFATGDYIIVIGDDDALLPNCLSKINEIIQANNLSVLRWERVYYSWPSIQLKALANKLEIPLNNFSGSILNSNSIIQKVIDLELPYAQLPMLYNSAVSIKILEEIKHLTGRVFFAISPDIYSGFSIAFVAKEYGSISYPLSINAGSAKSNGVNNVHIYGENEIKNDFEKLNETSEIKWPSNVPLLKSLTCAMMEAYVQFLDNFSEAKRKLNISHPKVMSQIISELQIKDMNDWCDAYNKIEKSLMEKKEALMWFKKAYDIHSFVLSSLPSMEWGKGYQRNWLLMDASDFNIGDVYEVAKFSQNIIGENFPDGAFKKVIIHSRYLLSIKKIIKKLLCL